MKPYRLDLDNVRQLRKQPVKSDNNSVAPKIESVIDMKTLEHYYRKTCPFKEIYKWLGSDPNREFSFSWSGGYRRWMIFTSAENLLADVLRSRPLKIHVGAIYDDLSLGLKSKPVKRELTFDIDLNDYKDDQGISIRSCC